MKTSKSGKGKDKKGAGERAPGGEVAQVERMLRVRTPLTEAQRTAFRSRFSDAQCDELGGRTKSGPVFREALDWAGQIQRTLAEPHEGLRYSEERFTWFLECLLGLARAREIQKSAQGSVGAARRVGERARAKAVALREDLIEMLGELAGAVEGEVEALAKARGSAQDNGELAASLRALADLAEGWLQRTTEVDRALVASAGLAVGHVEEARQAVETLEHATGASTLAGRAEVRDAPAVNRAEGRLLREMGVAMRSFAEARRKNGVIRKLTPGPATRRVLGKHRSTAEEAPTPPQQEPAEGENAPADNHAAAPNGLASAE